MTEPLNLGFDFDGVIGDTHGLMQEVASYFLGVDRPISHFASKAAVLANFSNEAAWFLYRTSHESHHWGVDRLKPIKNSLCYLRLLEQDGHNLSIITKRHSEVSVYAARTWLKRQGSNIKIYNVPRGETKVAWARHLRLDFFVDDELGNLIDLDPYVPNKVHFKTKHVLDHGLACIPMIDNWESLYLAMATLPWPRIS